MITCPKCGESFYIASNRCPNCNAEISPEERKKSEEQEAVQEKERLQARIEMFRKNRPRLYLGSGMSFALSIFCLGMAVATLKLLWILAVIGSVLLLAGIIVFFGFIKQGAFCPYCNEWLSSSRYHGDVQVCPWCRKNLME